MVCVASENLKYHFKTIAFYLESVVTLAFVNDLDVEKKIFFLLGFEFYNSKNKEEYY